MPSTSVVSQQKEKVIFISYSHADTGTATQIKTALERIGLNPWIDSTEIEPGQSFLQPNE